MVIKTPIRIKVDGNESWIVDVDGNVVVFADIVEFINDRADKEKCVCVDIEERFVICQICGQPAGDRTIIGTDKGKFRHVGCGQ